LRGASVPAAIDVLECLVGPALDLVGAMRLDFRNLFDRNVQDIANRRSAFGSIVVTAAEGSDAWVRAFMGRVVLAPLALGLPR
jgi:hypothetical protein